MAGFGMNPSFDWRRFGGETLQDIGVGLTQSPTIWGGIGRAAQIGQEKQPYRDQQERIRKEDEAKQQEIIKQQELRTKYADFFEQQGQGDWARAVADELVAPGDAYMEWMSGKQPKGPIKASAGDVFLDPETYQPIASIPDPKAQADALKNDFANEKDLYSQYSNSDPVKTYETVKGAYERVRQSAALDTGAGDMGLIYGYMKMLDPGSVVRESEFAMAAQTGSYGEQIQGLVQRVLTGERLTPSQRQAFQQAAEKLYDEAAGNLNSVNSQFTGRATRYNVDPSSFIRSPESFQPLTQIAPNDPLGIR
jgi:hypothetical protein